MSRRDAIDLDVKSPPFDQLRSIYRLSRDRSGKGSGGCARHNLYVARDKQDRVSVLIKLTARPGLVYQQDLANEIASLSTVNRELPDSRCFPVVREHGHLRDGRVFLITTLFDEFPLATSIGLERMRAKLVGHLRTAIEIAKAVAELHRLRIFHVDLNPMNVLYRWEKGAPVIRIVDFESAYEESRHSHGTFYSPPTTPGYSAPEVSRQAPDARADVFSLGAVLYTMLAGHAWDREVGACVQENEDLDRELKDILLTAVDPDRDRRYPSVQAFHSALATYLEHIWPGRAW